ncbi:MAG: 16S rRNA (guanine(527)-N(7))-methyltransferase RsmG [Cucumibacter sp.]
MSGEDHGIVRAVLPAWIKDTDRIIAGLEAYAALLRKWNETQNLVSRETLPDLWRRHFADSLQLLTLMQGPPTSVLDLGSGAGLPAIPLALACPGALFTLVDSNSKKAAFLRAAGRELGLELEVLAARVEIFDTDTFPDLDLITARAFAPLGELFEHCAPLWRADTRGLFHKGRQNRAEIAEALSRWRCDLLEHPSLIEPDSVILDVRRLEERD